MEIHRKSETADLKVELDDLESGEYQQKITELILIMEMCLEIWEKWDISGIWTEKM